MTSLRDNLFLLARANDERGIEKLFIHDSGELDERNDNGLTALHICATYGCLEACAILLKLGAKHSLQDFESGWTPLHRAFYFGNLKVSLLLIRAGASIADEGEKPDWKTDVFSRRERCRSIRNLASWKANIDHDGLSPLDLLSISLGRNLANSKKELLCTSVLSFGKADFTLGVPLPNSVAAILRPRRIEPLNCESITQIVASRYHSLALTKEGEVYSWGHGRAGRLGLGDENTQPEPRLITKLLGLVVLMVSAGENHTLAITNRGDMLSWGSDRFGQLGYGGSDAGKGSLFPRKVENLKKSFVVAIAAGDTHSVCFTDNGEIYSWGSNKEGQLGISPLEIGAGIGGGPGISAPKRVYLRGAKTKVKDRRDNKFQVRAAHCPLIQIVASRCSTLLLCRPEDYESTSGVGGTRTPNEVYQWGHGSPYPSRVQFSKGSAPSPSASMKDRDPMVDRFFSHCTAAPVRIVQLAAGLNHNVAVSSMGHVYTWGLGSDQLGHGSLENRLSVPQLLETLLPENGGGRAVMVSAANDRTCVVSDVGDLYTWGATAEKGILGLGAGSYQPIPKLVGGVKRAVSVAAGGDHTLVLTSASVPPMPFSDIVCADLEPQKPPVKSKSGPRSNVVVVTGLRPFGPLRDSLDSDVERRASTVVESSNASEGSDGESSGGYDVEEEEDESDGDVQLLSRSENLSSENIKSGLFLSRVLSLQELCEQRISESVDTRNAVALLAHAESIGAKALTVFCTQFIHSNLDAILVQSKPSDLDILIADHGSSPYPSLRSTYTTSAGIKTSHGGSGVGVGVRSGMTRKLSKEHLEWHSRDSRHTGAVAGVKFEGRERGHSGMGSYHKGAGSVWGDPVTEDGRQGQGQSPRHGSFRADSTYDECVLGFEGYKDKESTGRTRSQSKDFDSLSGVLKIIRSVKKKLQSIEELEARVRDGGIKELNEEQREKVSRKEALLSEMKRLKLICTRLEGEERVKAAAKVQRDKSIADIESKRRKEGEVNCISSSLKGSSDLVISINSPSCVSGTPSEPSTPTDQRPSNKNISSGKSDSKVNFKSCQDLEMKNAAVVAKSASSPSSSPDQLQNMKLISTKGSAQIGKAIGALKGSQFVPPSFTDWIQAAGTAGTSTDTFKSIRSAKKLPDSSSGQLFAGSKVETKKAWGTLSANSEPVLCGEMDSLSLANSRKPVQGLSTPSKMSISHMGVSGQTVLSPPMVKTAAAMSVSSVSLSMKSQIGTSVPHDKMGPREGERDTERIEKHPSYGLTLADLMVTPKKKQNSAKASEVVAFTPHTPVVLKSAPPCPWLTPSVPAQKEVFESVPSHAFIPSSGSKIKPKTLHEIQLEEETARLQSNLTSLKGNDNPWYQERRKRADSIEAVIRSQAEEKYLLEADRIEEENAIREVDLLKRREKREKMKVEKSRQKAKLIANCESKEKQDVESPSPALLPMDILREGNCSIGVAASQQGGGRAARGGRGNTRAKHGQGQNPSSGSVPSSSSTPLPLEGEARSEVCSSSGPYSNSHRNRGRGGAGRGGGGGDRGGSGNKGSAESPSGLMVHDPSSSSSAAATA